MSPRSSRDCTGKRIPQPLRRELWNGQWMRTQASTLRRLVARLRAKQTMGRGLERLDSEDLFVHLLRSAEILERDAPWSVCDCRGGTSTCPHCNGRGYLTHGQWRRMMASSSCERSGDDDATKEWDRASDEAWKQINDDADNNATSLPDSGCAGGDGSSVG